MISKSEKANSVRDYFIILRKFINYYKDHISEMILHLWKFKTPIFINNF